MTHQFHPSPIIGLISGLGSSFPLFTWLFSRWARIDHSDSYRRDNPLFAQLGAMVGMSDAEIDAAWPQALAIE